MCPNHDNVTLFIVSEVRIMNLCVQLSIVLFSWLSKIARFSQIFPWVLSHPNNTFPLLLSTSAHGKTIAYTIMIFVSIDSSRNMNNFMPLLC